ncbi:hypothetical protein GGS23DRAFT_209674 [Durotheca rogersii]|uniref:uncharacterized protein n=1 Tax=Durotheca rogersii TaxID=419775 RepID=UPI00221EEB23|nr:uncharacterized protein GGS23DRAFT_209674 [Durotheca rogersii]KAI5860785.1 hypothetical protein GGS23DRAFT_209674 [Durotheca rogersii]
MIPPLLRILQPRIALRASTLRRTVPHTGGVASGRTFVSKSRSYISRPVPNAPRCAAPRPAITNAPPRQIKPWLRTSRRSFHRNPRLRSATPPPKGATPPEPQGFSARLKKLSREYGWAALGVYLGLTVLDFPFCFLLVRAVGTERIGEIEHFVISNVKKAIPESVRNRWQDYRDTLKSAEKERFGNENISEQVEVAGWGVEEAERRHKSEASLGTQLALAYAIHKSFIFVRVPLTAAITPRVVKTLRSWGWNIGKRPGKR